MESVKLFLVDITTLSELHGNMTVNDILRRMWEEIVMCYLKYYPVSEWRYRGKFRTHLVR
jgi:hypothetical protein